MITLEALLLLLIIAVAFLAVFSKEELSSIISLSIFSVSLATLYLLFKAPDVAVAELVIGAGFNTAIFMTTISKVRTEKRERIFREKMKRKNLLVLLTLSLLSGVLLLNFNYIPDQQIVPGQLAEHIIRTGVTETGSLNLVTAILYDYRAFDSLGESTVVFAAVSAIVLILSFKTLPVSSHGLSFIVKRTFGFLTPFIFLFGLYIITHGHISPGGGFQGGVILASISIIFSIVYGSSFDYQKYSPKFKTTLETGGALLFVLVGGIGIITEGFFLANLGPLFGQNGSLISAGSIPLINLGVGFKIGAGLAIIFYSMIQKTYGEEL